MTNQRAVRLLVAATLASLLAASSGCKLFAAPFLLWGKQPTKEVVAEFPHLQGKRVCILVWADAETLAEYPWIQLELSEHISTALEANVEKVSFIPNKKVHDLQRREADWDRQDPAILGARFGAERVLMVELTQCTTREPESPHLYRGRIAGTVKIYNADYPNSAPVYKTAVDAVYPPDSAGQWGSGDQEVRKAALETFATELAGKFYDRRVKVN